MTDNRKIIFQEHHSTPSGDVVAMNKHDDACYEEAPTIEIPRNDFDFLMQVFDKYETSKTKRAEVQRNYFKSNKKTYYERQKKWRDGHKLEINVRRRERYAEKKLIKIPDAPEEEASEQALSLPSVPLEPPEPPEPPEPREPLAPLASED